MSSKTITRIGPADQGRPMSLAEFEHAEAEGERLYELSRGVITVVDVPKPRHLKLFDALHQQFSDFKSKHPKLIYAIAGGGECKLLIADLESERHPDLAIYKTPPPEAAIFWGLLIFSERGFGDCCANLWGDGHASHAEWIDMFSVLDASRRLPRP